jgi:glycosyltransferase involved in cell wall biosynthesis
MVPAIAASTEDPASELPLVSIIFLTYNQEKYIGEALHGLLSQTYPRLDIIITDDASTDATVELIAAELARYPDRSDIRFIRNKENLGGFGRGNFLNALSFARGEFVVISCGDDVMLPRQVEAMARVWRDEDVSLVTANALYIDQDSHELDRFRHSPDQPFDDSFETLARNGVNDTCFGAAMGFERQLHDEFGWPPAYLTASDIMLPFFAYLAKGARFIPEPLLKYRVHPQNTSLSLAAEATSDPSGRLIAEEHMHYVLLAHAFLMESELDRANECDPERFDGVVEAIKPLVEVQIVERARKLLRARIELSGLGISRLAAPRPDAGD